MEVPIAHPLSGADLGTLLRVLKESGGGVRRAPLVAIFASVLGRWPMTQLERRTAGARAKARALSAPPVFILGHWRSGTTHLYNIMSHGRFGYVPPVAAGLPHELLTLGTWAKPLLEKALPESRYIDNVAVTPTSPQEDEPAIANMTALSFYHALYFPKAFDHFLRRGLFFDGATTADIEEWEAAFTLLMQKLAMREGEPLLIKNPVYTARPAQLLRLFPEAKFIHIHRDPYDVFLSMRNFYRKLLDVMALQPYDHVDIDAIVLDTYARMMTAYEDQTTGWAAPRLFECGYGDLDRDPLGTVRAVYDALDLDGFAEAEPRFRAYLGTVKSYQKNRFERDHEAEEKIAAAWAPWVSRFSDRAAAGADGA